MIYAAAVFSALFFVFTIAVLVHSSNEIIDEPLRFKAFSPGVTYANFLLLNPVTKITLSDAFKVLGSEGKKIGSSESGAVYRWKSDPADGDGGEVILSFAGEKLIGAEEKNLDPLFSEDILREEALNGLAAFRGYIGGFQHINDKLSALTGKRPCVRRRYALGKSGWSWGKQERELIYRTAGGKAVVVYFNNGFKLEHYLSFKYWFAHFFRCDWYNDADIGRDCEFQISDVIIEGR